MTGGCDISFSKRHAKCLSHVNFRGEPVLVIRSAARAGTRERTVGCRTVAAICRRSRADSSASMKSDLGGYVPPYGLPGLGNGRLTIGDGRQPPRQQIPRVMVLGWESRLVFLRHLWFLINCRTTVRLAGRVGECEDEVVELRGRGRATPPAPRLLQPPVPDRPSSLQPRGMCVVLPAGSSSSSSSKQAGKQLARAAGGGLPAARCRAWTAKKLQRCSPPWPFRLRAGAHARQHF